MEVRNCRGCGRLFNYIGGGYSLCPACMEQLDKKFNEVKAYIRENPKATIPQISQDNDVSVIQIERWVREERLVFSDDSPIGLDCEGCGVTIKSGRFCPQCKDAMQKSFGSLYKDNTPKIDPRRTERDRARMRYLDGQKPMI